MTHARNDSEEHSGSDANVRAGSHRSHEIERKGCYMNTESSQHFTTRTGARIHRNWFRPMPAARPLPSVYTWIRRELQRSGLSCAKASELAGMNRQTVSVVLRTQRPPMESTVRKLAVVFGTDPEWAVCLPGVARREAA